MRASATPTKKHLVVIAAKKARFHSGDLSIVASRSGWKLYEARWDSDNAAPVVAAFEAEKVVVVLVGLSPLVDSQPLERLLLRQGFPVVAIDVSEGLPAATGEPAAWVFGVTSFSTGRAPLPEDSALRLESFDPTAIVRAADSCP